MSLLLKISVKGKGVGVRWGRVELSANEQDE